MNEVFYWFPKYSVIQLSTCAQPQTAHIGGKWRSLIDYVLINAHTQLTKISYTVAFC